jgi:hypothetical protein
MNIFHSPRELYRQPYFIVSVAISLTIAILIVLAAAIFLQQNKIYIEPIAELRIVSQLAGSSENNVKPISEILNMSNAHENTVKKSTLSAYLVNLRDVCDMYDETNGWLVKPEIVLVKTNEGFTAGTMTISPKTCKKD